MREERERWRLAREKSERETARGDFFFFFFFSVTKILSEGREPRTLAASLLSLSFRAIIAQTSSSIIMETSSALPPLKIIGEREIERERERTRTRIGASRPAINGDRPKREAFSCLAAAPHFHPNFLPEIENAEVLLLKNMKRQNTSSTHRKSPDKKTNMQLASPTPSASSPSSLLPPPPLVLSRPTRPSPPSRRPIRPPSAPAANGWPFPLRTG